MKSRLIYLVKIYLFMVFMLVIAKPVFMLCNHANQTFTGSDMLAVIGHGLSLDLSTALYLILFPFLVAFLSVWTWHWNPLRQILKIYYAVAAFVLSLAFVADTSLYKFWGFKLDASVIPYLSTPKEAFASVSVWNILLRILIIAVLTVIIYFILVWLTPQQKEHRRSIGFVSYSRRTTSSSRFSISPIKKIGQRLVATVVFLLMIPLIVIGLRGGLNVSTSNVGQVYFSQNQFLNHSAVNPFFSFVSSFGKTVTVKESKSQYNYFSEKDLKKQLAGLFDTRSVNPQMLLNTQRPNIVLIILEGCGSIFTEANNNGHVTPNLTKLMNEGVYFTSCIANSWRTDRGMVSILSGYPAFPDKSVMKMAQKCETLPSIARTLKDNGYTTEFMYGGDADFTNTRGYLTSTGYERIISEDDFTKEERGDSKWGVNDWVVLNKLHDNIVNNKPATGKPWFTTLLTLSSHEPWTVPMKKKFDDEILNAFYFTDICLGNFIKNLKKSSVWENTLVVIVPDHSIQYQDIDQTKKMRNRIPMIWTGGAVKKPARVGMACNQTDLAATLFGQMGIKHDEFTFSRDILSTNYKRQFAMNNWPEGFATYDASGFNVYDLKSNKVVVGTAGNAIETGKAVLQASEEDLCNR